MEFIGSFTQERFPMIKLVAIRHGQSEWNLANRFTGWADVALSEQGLAEARQAGEILKQHHFTFDLAYTSYLKRAQQTLAIALETLGQPDLPVIQDWRLNERHYGGLTGLDKDEMRQRYGEAQVHIWRRSYDVPPPLPTEPLSQYPGFDNRYADFGDIIPQTESLKDTLDRFLPVWNDTIAPQLLAGKRIIISAHGNSLRAMVKHLSNIPDSDITSVEIPTGQPFVYELDAQLKPLQPYYYLTPVGATV